MSLFLVPPVVVRYLTCTLLTVEKALSLLANKRSRGQQVNTQQPFSSSHHFSPPPVAQFSLSLPLPSPPLPSPHLTSPHLTSPHLTSPHLTSPHLTSPHLTSPHLTSPHLTSPHLTSPHLTSPHLTSPHLTSPHTSHLTSPPLPSLPSFPSSLPSPPPPIPHLSKTAPKGLLLLHTPSKPALTETALQPNVILLTAHQGFYLQLHICLQFPTFSISYVHTYSTISSIVPCYWLFRAFTPIYNDDVKVLQAVSYTYNKAHVLWHFFHLVPTFISELMDRGPIMPYSDCLSDHTTCVVCRSFLLPRP